MFKKVNIPPKKILIYCAIVSLAVLIPVLFGFINAEQNEVYTLLDFPEDAQFYSSFINQVKYDFSIPQDSPAFFYENKIFIVLLFWLMGIFSVITGISVPATYLFIRLLINFSFLISVWFLMKTFFENEKEQIVAFIIATIGGGFSWIFYFGGFIIPKLQGVFYGTFGNIGLSTFTYLIIPHHILNYLLFVLVYFLYLKFEKTKNKLFLFIIFILFLLIYFIDPSSGLIFYPIIFITYILKFIFSKKQKIKGCIYPLIPLIGAGIIIGSHFFISMMNPSYSGIVKAFTEFNRFTPVFWYPFVFGLILLFVIFGLTNAKLNGFKKYFLWAWLIVAFFMAVNPWKGFKYIYYLHIPFAIFATFGLIYLIKKYSFFKILSDKRYITILLLFLSLNSFGILIQRSVDMNSEQYPSLFMHNSEKEAMDFLNTVEKGKIISSYYFANNNMWNTPHKNFFAHWNTGQPNLPPEEAKNEVYSFYSPTKDNSWKKNFLKKNNINYVVYGPREKELGTIDSINLELENIYQNEPLIIYSTKTDIIK